MFRCSATKQGFNFGADVSMGLISCCSVRIEETEQFFVDFRFLLVINLPID